jgi:predicted small secreted protein
MSESRWNFARALTIALTAGSASLAACGTARQSGLCGDISPAPSATGDFAALEKQGDEAWLLRGDRAQAEAAINGWTEALKVDPARHEVRTKLARGHYYFADSVLWMDYNIEGDLGAGEKMVSHYEQAANQAEMALGQRYPAYRSKYCSNQPFKVALEQLDKDAVPAMYWYAASLSRYALMTSIFEVLNQKDRIRAMMALIERFDPKFWYWAADRYQGGFYTKVPFPDGDLPLSAKHFEKSISNAPEYLATKVIYAEMNAAKAKCGRPLFERLLNEVIAFDLESAPEIKAENAAEQRKAKYFLEDIDNLVSGKPCDEATPAP